MGGEDAMERMDDGAAAVGRAAKRILGPAGCRAYVRRRVASEFPKIVDGFLKEARSGSVPHLKLATELLKPERKGTGRKKDETMRALDRLVKSRPVKETVLE